MYGMYLPLPLQMGRRCRYGSWAFCHGPVTTRQAEKRERISERYENCSRRPGVLWGFFLALYVASKIHFFTRYDPLGFGSYLREYSTYWVAMAAVVFLIWLVGKQFPQDRQ